jgi:hypothetical protein
MKELGDLLHGIPLLGLVTAAFLTGALYGSNFSSEDWETLSAGFLGLLGGTFALLAAKSQINHQQNLEEVKKQRTIRRFLKELEITLQFIDYTLEVIQDKNHQVTAEDREIFVAFLLTFSISNIPLEIPDRFSQPALEIRRNANFLRETINTKLIQKHSGDDLQQLSNGEIQLIDEMATTIRRLISMITDHFKSTHNQHSD